MKPYLPYCPLPAEHIVLLGSPWNDASGICLAPGDSCEEVRKMALYSASAEMALEPLRKIAQRIHDFHAGITRIHPTLEPVQKEMLLAIDALKRAEDAYQIWRESSRKPKTPTDSQST